MLDEAFQSTVPGRESSRMDFTADMVGAVAGLFALVQGSRMWERVTRRPAGRGES
jgi:VanZ family protein